MHHFFDSKVHDVRTPQAACDLQHIGDGPVSVCLVWALSRSERRVLSRIVYADQLAQSCGGVAGTYCSVDGSSAATGSYPAYEFHSGTCVPTACDDAYHGALQAWAEGFACGDAYWAPSAYCSLSVTCAYPMKSSTVWEIVGIAVGSVFVLILLCCVAYCAFRGRWCPCICTERLDDEVDELPDEGVEDGQGDMLLQPEDAGDPLTRLQRQLLLEEQGHIGGGGIPVAPQRTDPQAATRSRRVESEGLLTDPLGAGRFTMVEMPAHLRRGGGGESNPGS